MTVIHSRYREPGVPAIDLQTCQRCGQCVAICPAEAIRFAEGNVTLHTESRFGCIACGHCMLVCPHGSITVSGRGISPKDVLAAPPADSKATPAALAALLEGRRSIRRFTDEEVAKDTLEAIVGMAASAPMGIPPWDVGCTVVCGRAQVHKLAEEIIQGYAGFLKLFRPWVLAWLRPFLGRAKHDAFRSFIRPLAESLVEHHRHGRDVLFWNAPAVMLFHHSPYADASDAAIACTYAMLVAESLGLGTTMIGSVAPIIQRRPQLARSLGIPAGHRAALALIVGHPAVTFRRAILRRFNSVTLT